MPQFTYDPNNPGAAYVNTATGGDAFGQKKRKKKKKPAASPVAAVASAPVANSSKKDDKKKPPKKQRPAKAPYNPLTAPFKTPAELRAEAARLAALSVPDEMLLRNQQANEEANLTGVTTALASRLGDVANTNNAAMQGFGNLYNTIAQGAQTAGQSAAAAAGGPIDVAQGASPAMASALANIAATTQGLVPAAYATGAQLVGRSQGSLSRALTERASALSENTAKYLQQLQDRELERAISGVSLDQNAQRLSLTEQGQQQDFMVDQANLGLRQDSNNIQWQKLNQSLAKDIAKAGKDAKKRVQAAKDNVLNNREKWTTEKAAQGAVYEVQIDDGINGLKPVQIVASSPEEAKGLARQQYKREPVGIPYFVRDNTTQRQLSEVEVLRRVVPKLVNAGMTRKNAIQWVRVQLLGLSPQNAGGIKNPQAAQGPAVFSS